MPRWRAAAVNRIDFGTHQLVLNPVIALARKASGSYDVLYGS